MSRSLMWPELTRERRGSALFISRRVGASPAMLTDECAEFLLDVLGFRLDETESLWFFSDWSHCSPRDFGQRLQDLCLSRLHGEP